MGSSAGGNDAVAMLPHAGTDIQEPWHGTVQGTFRQAKNTSDEGTDFRHVGAQREKTETASIAGTEEDHPDKPRIAWLWQLNAVQGHEQAETRHPETRHPEC